MYLNIVVGIGSAFWIDMRENDLILGEAKNTNMSEKGKFTASLEGTLYDIHIQDFLDI